MEVLLGERDYKSLFPVKSRQCGTSDGKRVPLPFASLHGAHRGFDVLIIAVDLLQEVLLAFSQLTEGFRHALHFLLSLDPLPMLAANIAGNRIQNALEVIFSRDFPLFLELQ